MPKFSDSRTGRFCAATVLYSLTGTFRHHDIDPLACVQDILHRLPSPPPHRSAQRAPARRLVRVAHLVRARRPRRSGCAGREVEGDEPGRGGRYAYHGPRGPDTPVKIPPLKILPHDVVGWFPGSFERCIRRTLNSVHPASESFVRSAARASTRVAGRFHHMISAVASEVPIASRRRFPWHSHAVGASMRHSASTSSGRTNMG